MAEQSEPELENAKKSAAENRQKLLELEIRDRIETRLWSRVRLIGGLVSGALVLFGILGIPYTVETMQDRVIFDVKKDLEEDVEDLKQGLKDDVLNLRNQFTKDYADLLVAKKFADNEVAALKKI